MAVGTAASTTSLVAFKAVLDHALTDGSLSRDLLVLVFSKVVLVSAPMLGTLGGALEGH